MNNVFAIVIQGEAPVRQSQHPIPVGALSGEQSGATRRACWRGTIGLAKEDALRGEALEIWRGHGIAKRLEISS